MDFVTGNIVTTIIVAVYAVVLVFYLRAEVKNDGGAGFKKATALKLTLSGMFCGVAVLSQYLLFNNTVRSLLYINIQWLVVAARGFAFFGDYYLQYIKLDVKKFKRGIGFFMVAQILLIAMMCLLYRWASPSL
jgi:hypothetical protein